MKKTKRIVSITIAAALVFSAISLTTVFSSSSMPSGTAIGDIPGTFPATMTLGADIAYNTDKMSMPNYPNYASAQKTKFTPNLRKLLVDGWANDDNVRQSVNAGYLDEPEFVFDLARPETIQTIRIGGYNTNGQAVFFRLFVSSDGDVWDEIGNTNLGCQYNAVLVQPVLPFNADGSIMLTPPPTASPTTVISADSYKNMFAYDFPWFQINPLPYPTVYKSDFDLTTSGYADATQNGKESPFSFGQYKSRILLDPSGSAREVPCFATPIYAKASNMYGIPDQKVNYLNNYYLEKPVTCRFVKIVGYGNNSQLYYPFTSITEVRFAAPAPVEPSVQVFSDVSSDRWAAKDIHDLSVNGIINGYVNGSETTDVFKPDNTILKQEFIKIITYAFYAYNPFANYDKFSDLSQSDWYYLYVASAATNSVTEPLLTGEGPPVAEGDVHGSYFGVDQNMNRQDTATFIARALSTLTKEKLPTLDEANANTLLKALADKDQIPDYAKPSVAYLLDRGVIKGYDLSGVVTFRPDKLVSREEVCAMTARGIYYKTVDQLTDSIPTPTPTPAPTPAP
jgi:hypothetical protein